MNKKTVLIACACAAAAVVIAAILLFRPRASVRALGPGQATASRLLAEAKKLEADGNLLAAKAHYQKLIGDFPNSREVQDWQKRAEDIAMRLLFSPTVTPKSIAYQVKAGDSLSRIARAHKTTVELLIKSNNLKNEIIFPGQTLKVWTSPFSIVVDKSQNTLILKSEEDIYRTYVVSTGLNNSTPVGTFVITEKILNPPWYKPGGGMVPAGDPQNILGTRWLGLNKEGYGIHGTTEPQSLGKQATAGCVRMSNSDVEQLYSIVPSGTEVIIVD